MTLSIPITSTNTQTPPLLLSSLPPEILHSIISYIDWRGVNCLIRVCKSLYDVAYHHFLEDVTFRSFQDDPEEFCMDPDRWGQMINRDRLSHLISAAPSLPWNWTRRIEIQELYAIANLKLLKVLQAKIKGGMMNPQHIEIDVTEDLMGYQTSLQPCIDIGFFDIMKSYTADKPINKFSYSLIGGSLLFKLEGLIPFEIVAKLSFVYDHSEMRILESKKVIFSGLTTLIGAAVNLRKLSLCIKNIGLEEDDDTELVEGIQRAFDRLHTLVELHIVSGFLKDSIFIIPPPNTKFLSLRCGHTPLWWHKFSQCKLPKIESLTLIPNDSRWCSESERERLLEAEHHLVSAGSSAKFQIADLALTTLYHFRGAIDSSAPSNFLDLLFGKNPGLTRASNDVMFYQVIRPMLSMTISRIRERIIKYGNSAADEYCEKWKAGKRGKELEKDLLKGILELLTKEASEGKLEE
ncbi:hypothetical protein TWF192_000771 [Orbilia oligospora]|uniref:Uncharacterized protein n=1 Tax=Orbilia oligospora TaxID=2813651 RepID=A0A6G1LWR9_ORBOL|nr:hypothetical protein TWF191_007461 [Orbilia oligospora]KAF3235321.1 hypothetical protein TWF192_000771 [Orbilia oligospora]